MRHISLWKDLAVVSGHTARIVTVFFCDLRKPSLHKLWGDRRSCTKCRSKSFAVFAAKLARLGFNSFFAVDTHLCGIGSHPDSETGSFLAGAWESNTMRNRETDAAGTQRIDIGNSPLPNVINLVLPERMRNHPLMSGKWFYTLPSPIWVELCAELGRDCFDADVLDLEISASQQADAIEGCVGFHSGVPIYDFHLRPVPPIDFSAPEIQQYFAQCRAAGYKTPTSNGLINKKLDALKMPQKAYLGWLLTCPSFLTELQELRTEFREVFDCGQSPPISLQLSMNADASGSSQWLEPTDDPTAQAVSAFCRRWRIGNVVGPVTFLPLSIQFPVALPMRASMDTQSSGSLLYIPDIAPVPNRDLLEQLVEEVVRQTIQRAPHLAEWVELAHGGKLGRKKLNHFAKAYELQHFIRVLYARHGDRLNRHQTKIYQVIGANLKIKSDQMLRTMQRIRRRLGKDWLTPESLSVLHR